MQMEGFRKWIEQKYISIPQLFFQYYKQLSITDDEAMLLLHIIVFHEEGNDFPTPYDLQSRTNFELNEISMKIQTCIQKGFLEMTQGVDEQGKMFEKYVLYPLWEQLIFQLEKKQLQESGLTKVQEEGKIFSMFEQEFGRLLTPIEIETIGLWLDQDQHSPVLIKEALKEAVLAGKVSFRYIDRILLEWKKKNFTSVRQVEEHTAQFRKYTMTQATEPQQTRPKRKISAYNWLEEDD